MQEIRRRISKATDKYEDLELSVRNLTSFRQGAPVDIDFSIVGPDLDRLAEFSDKLHNAERTGLVDRIPGIVDVYNTLRLDKPDLYVDISRERAATLAVDVEEIAETLRIAVGGDDRVSRYRDKQLDDVYDVELQPAGLDRGDSTAISQLYVRAPSPSSNGASEAVQSVPSDALVAAAGDPPAPAISTGSGWRRCGRTSPRATPWPTASRPCARRPPRWACRRATAPGSSAAARRLYRAARCPLVFFTDSDGQYAAAEFWKLAGFISQYDVVHGAKRNRQDPLLRRVFSAVFNRIAALLFDQPYDDINSALRLMRVGAIRKALERVSVMPTLFNAELLLRCLQENVTIRQVPVLHRRRRAGRSRGLPAYRYLLEAWWALKGLVKIKAA